MSYIPNIIMLERMLAALSWNSAVHSKKHAPIIPSTVIIGIRHARMGPFAFFDSSIMALVLLIIDN